jgi:hypothetical protein
MIGGIKMVKEPERRIEELERRVKDLEDWKRDFERILNQKLKEHDERMARELRAQIGG